MTQYWRRWAGLGLVLVLGLVIGGGGVGYLTKEHINRQNAELHRLTYSKLHPEALRLQGRIIFKGGNPQLILDGCAELPEWIPVCVNHKNGLIEYTSGSGVVGGGPCEVTPVFGKGYYQWSAVLGSSPAGGGIQYLEIKSWKVGELHAYGRVDDVKIGPEPTFQASIQDGSVRWQIQNATHGTAVLISWDHGQTWEVLNLVDGVGNAPLNPEQLKSNPKPILKLQGFVGTRKYERLIP